MVCNSCTKNKASAAANAARTDRVLYRPTPIVEGLAATHAITDGRYKRVMYVVASREALAAAGDDIAAIGEAETLPTLAEAQKRVRDLGPAYGIKTIRV